MEMFAGNVQRGLRLLGLFLELLGIIWFAQRDGRRSLVFRFMGIGGRRCLLETWLSGNATVGVGLRVIENYLVCLM